MTYEETRKSEQLRILNVAIGEFISRYRSRPPGMPRHTILFFPGSIGSALLRAETPYQDGEAAPQEFEYKTLWLTEASLDPRQPDRNAMNFRMHKQSGGTFRDQDDRIIIANGAVKFDVSNGPYDEFFDWCGRAGLDWFVFGWDWRRRLEETATFFLQVFLPHFRTAVMNACGSDPLARFALIAHSHGGVVANFVLRELENHGLEKQLSNLITVATPFYGVSAALHQLFKANEIFGLLGQRPVVEVTSSLPASYTINWLQTDTFDAHRADFETDPVWPLRNYPSVDASEPQQRVDPYDTPTQAGQRRYPTITGFDSEELSHAKVIRQRLDAPLTPNLAQKSFNIRSVLPDNITPDDTSWEWISPLYDPDHDETPIKDGPAGAGDKLVPAWSAHLLRTPKKNRRTVNTTTEHMFLMADSAIQSEIGQILGVDQALVEARQPRAEDRGEPATIGEAIAYLKGLHQLRSIDGAPASESDVAKYREQFPHGKLCGIQRRILMDMLI